MPDCPEVHCEEQAKAHPLAAMLAQLLRDNLTEHASKRRACHALRGRVAIVADDIDSSVTLHFQPGRVEVQAGIVGIPDLTVRGSSELILELSRLKLLRRLPLPDPRDASNRAVFRALLRRQLRLFGLPGALPVAVRLAQVMSVYG